VRLSLFTFSEDIVLSLQRLILIPQPPIAHGCSDNTLRIRDFNCHIRLHDIPYLQSEITYDHQLTPYSKSTIRVATKASNVDMALALLGAIEGAPLGIGVGARVGTGVGARVGSAVGAGV
jgi:hypothetical protein